MGQSSQQKKDKKNEKLGFGMLHDLIDINKDPEQDLKEIKALEKKKSMRKKKTG